MSSEVMQGERRCVAKRLKVGDRVLRSVETGAEDMRPFTVARIGRCPEMGDFLLAVSETGGRYLFWPTDTVMVETKR